MNWILITLFISASTGELDHYTAAPIGTLQACVERLQGAHPVVDGLAEVRICRVVDKDGKAVPEIKVDPNGKPLNDGAEIVDDAPKATT